MAERRAARLKQQRSIDTRESLLAGAAVVFSRLSYGEARTRDIAYESGISEGALYFHFGTKAEIAVAVLDAQQDRMTAVLSEVQSRGEHSLDKMMMLLTRLADLIAKDQVVQAGIKLAGQSSPEIAESANAPYFEWVQIVRSLLQEGIKDGSVRSSLDVDREAQHVNAVFVGAQVLSGLADSWASFPDRIAQLIPSLTESIQA